MNALTTLFERNGLTASVPLGDMLSGLLLAFVLGQLAAWVYVYTHSGLSYSRSFVQSIILLTVIVCLGMMVIGNNVVIAFGLIGALAVIRFRNILKDTRDTAFIFFALVVGMATGTGSYMLAVVGTLAFVAILLYLAWSGFGTRHSGDGYVRLQIDSVGDGHQRLREAIRQYCRSSHLVSQRLQESGVSEVAYRLTMRDPAQADEMIRDLRDIEGISKVSFVFQEEQIEV